MSLKDLFESTKVTKSGSADETAYDVESEAYVEAYTADKNEYLPPVDFSTASNFARYGSAAKYYEDAINRIHDDYPYDGSRYEVMAFHNSSSYLDRWMLEYKYPTTTGYIHLGTTSGSGDWLTMVSESSGVGGYGMPDTSDNNILEYIHIKGGPHTGSADRTFETQTVSLKKLFDYSNVYDSGSSREYNLEYDLRTGVTVEFWMLKNSFYTTKTEREVVFDLWNNENSSSAGYGRLMIELSGGADAGSSVRLTALSGTTGFVNEPIASITPSEVADGVWKHYAVTLKNHAEGGGVTAKLYVNGQLSGSSKLGSAILGRVTGSMLANIGALVAPPSGATGFYDSTTIAKGGAKLSASMDEFRFWKLERDARQVGRNWHTQVGGGTNRDDANVGLGVYYKFNEGIANSGSRDRTVLDYSGRISNGFWKGGVAECRNSGSAMASGSHNMNEFQDPIIYSEHPDVQALKDDIIQSGSVWDQQNNSLLSSGFPDWVDTESRDTTQKHFLQIMASYFDKLYMQIEGLSKIKDKYAGSYATGDVSASFKPVPFARNLVSQYGITTPELLGDAELIETFLNRNEKEQFGEKLHNIRNQIYSNVYANMLYIFKSKGTEKSMRNMLRCFGIDDELVKINAYSDNSDYVFKDNRRTTSNRTNYVSFATNDRREATIYQAVSMSVDGVYDNPNARAYITGSSNFGEFNAQTIECEAFFPLKVEPTDSEQWYQDSFFTASVFGAMGTVESQTDTRFPTDDPVDLRVLVVKDKLESKRAKFVLSSSVLGELDTDYYEDLYDDTRWNLAVRVKPSKYPWVDHISGTISAGDPMGAQTFDVEFYGVNVFTDVIQQEFLKTTTVTEAVGKAFLSSSKRCYVGALHENFTGSILHYSNVEVGNLRYWFSDVSDEVVLAHAMDQSSFGVSSPYKNVFLYQTDMSGTYVPQIETLALHWNFDNVTGSGNSPSPTAGSRDAQFIVQDISSGSAEHGDRYEARFSDQVKMQHLGIGDFFLANKTDVVNTRYIPTAKQVLPEYVNSSDMVEIRQRDDEFFTRETRPNKVYYSIEKSMYQTISEEMIKMFATIKDFDNLIGEPVNRYRHEYKDLAKLRQLFFERMPNSPDLDKYLDYYKWIDSAVSTFLEDLMPASTVHSKGMQNMVESHILERNKYQTKYPSMEFEGEPPIGSAEGINKLLYDYQRGHAPVPLAPGGAEMMDQDDNCLWWNKRAEREHPILASVAMSASNPAMNLSGALTSRISVFSASTSAYDRKLHTPYNYSVSEARVIHGGINFDSNKKLGYVYPATVPFSPRPLDHYLFGGYPLGYLLAKDMDTDASPSASLPSCDLPLSSSYGAKVKREGYKVIDGWETFKSNTGGEADTPTWESSSYTTFRGNLVMPFNVISSSQHDVNAGYTALVNQDLTVYKGTGVGHSTDAGTYVNKQREPTPGLHNLHGDEVPTKVGGMGRGVNLVNLHTDTYGDDKETPMQGPFTEKYVGGRKYRHADINDGTDTLHNRQEGWLVLISTAMSTSVGVLHATSGGVGLVGPDYPYPHGPYPFRADDVVNWRPIGGRYYRDEVAKRPLNIKNIQMKTSSLGYETIGAHRVDTIASSGDAEGDWTKKYHEQIATGSARTILGNYRHNYEIVHTVGRSNQKPFLRDNQSIRNIEQTGSFATVATDTTPVRSDGTGALPKTTHVETVLTQKFMASSSLTADALVHVVSTDPANPATAGNRVLVADVSGGLGGTDDTHLNLDFTVQNRETGSTNLNTIIANRFSAPGGPRNQSKGFLDLAAEEYSVYNAYTFRNLEVLGSSSGEQYNISASIHDSEHYPRLGLQSLRRLPSGKFGVENVAAQDTEIQDHSHDYDLRPSWHKIHRNTALGHRREASATFAYLTIFFPEPPAGNLLEGQIKITAWRDHPTLTYSATFYPKTAAEMESEGAQPGSTYYLNRFLDSGGAASAAALADAINAHVDLGGASPSRVTAVANGALLTVSQAQVSGEAGEIPITSNLSYQEGDGPLDDDVTINGEKYSIDWGNKWPSNLNSSTLMVTHYYRHGRSDIEVERLSYDNDYVTRPIPRNDFQYAWISASLQPSSSHHSLANLGYGYHIDAYRHPTTSGSRPVDPINFISASQNGSAYGDANTHATASDRGFRYMGIPSTLGTDNIPNVHMLNLNVRDSQNNWLTDGSGALGLGFYASGGILPSNEFPIDHPVPHQDGAAYASKLGNLHNYTNTPFLGYRNTSWTSPQRVKWGQGALNAYGAADNREPLIFEGKPGPYWSGSADDQDASGHAENQAHASVFNGLMWKRNGPYGYPTWKQIRTGDHPLVTTMRKNNRYVVVDPQSDRVVNPPPGTVGRTAAASRMRGADAVAAYRRLGHINVLERKHHHYYVPVTDRATPLYAAIHKGSIPSILTAGGVELYEIDPDKMLYASVTHLNNLKNFPQSKLNEDLGLRNLKQERTAYHDLKQMYVEMLDINGDDAYSLVDLTYREPLFPQSKHLGNRDFRKRPNFDAFYWADDDNAEYVDQVDDSGNEPFYDPVGRRAYFQDPDPRHPHGVWEFSRGVNASVNRITPYVAEAKINVLAYDAFVVPQYNSVGVITDRTTEVVNTDLKSRNRFTLMVSSSVWPMDGGRDTESTSVASYPSPAGWRASGSNSLVNHAEDFTVEATTPIWTNGAPGILQNQFTWFHNGMAIGFEPTSIGGTGDSDDPAEVRGLRNSVVSSSLWSNANFADIIEVVGSARFDHVGTQINERYVQMPAAGMAFAPSYSRPHMLVGRDSYCSPSAGKAAYSRRFLFAAETADLEGASTYGKGDGVTPFFPALDGNNATIPHTASTSPKALSMGERVVSQLTRSIGHDVEGLYVSDWKWKAPEQSGKAPFYANYSKWFEDMRGKTQDRQVLPEYRISDRMPHFVLDKQGRFTSPDAEWLKMLGAPSASQGALTSSWSYFGMGDEITSSFMSDYAMTAETTLLDAIKEENAGIAEPYELTLTCDAVLKFLPYQGFYPQLRTVDLCKQFIDSYDDHVSFNSDMDVGEKSDVFIRVDSSGSLTAPAAGNWYAFSPFHEGGGLIGSSQTVGVAPFINLVVKGNNNGASNTNSIAQDSYIAISTGDASSFLGGSRIAIKKGSGTDGTFSVATSGGGATLNGVVYSAVYTISPKQAQYSFINHQYFDAELIRTCINDAFANEYIDVFCRGGVNGYQNQNGVYEWELRLTYGTNHDANTNSYDGTIGSGGNGLASIVTVYDADNGTANEWSPTSTTANSDQDLSGVINGKKVAFGGGVNAAGSVLGATFYSDENLSAYNYSLDEIQDPTNQRVGGSGQLTNNGMETHGRNAAAAKRPFYGPFMAPGILFNTIKSGIAVDYPVLSRKLAVTASVDRDGGRNYQIYNEYFDGRLPFETLVQPERYLTDVPLIDMEPHPSASINVTASWDGQGDPLYKMMMHNFLAEIPNFYLADQTMQSFVSLPESDGAFGQVEAVMHNGDQVIPEYRMMVKLFKSQELSKVTLPPSASNHWQNHRGALHGFKQNTIDGSLSGALVYAGQYEPCYYTDVIGMSNFGAGPEGGSGIGYMKDIYHSPYGVDYNRSEVTYGRPQRDAPETITMYSRPSAFGPPSAGGYAFMPELENIFTGSAAPMSMSYGAGAGSHVPGSGSVGKVADRIGTTHGMKDGSTGYNAPFTPPYYDGQAWAFVTFKPTRTGKHYLDDIWENTTINFLRYEFDYVSGAYGDWGTIGPQGYAMNVNAMQIDAAVNLKARTTIKEVTYDATTGLPRSVADSLSTSARNSAWVIQTKLETPILHFGYGLTDNQTAPTLSGSAAASCAVESNGYHHGYPGLCEPIGMWHQYGEIPSASQGIYLEVADIPLNYLRFGTEMTIANPKWLHITGSPDWTVGATAGAVGMVSNGVIFAGSPDWDGHITGSDFLQTLITGSEGAASLKGYGYRFSGSFSGSEEAYIVGRATIDHPDRVADGTLPRGGRQQYMRWRLMSTGSLAGIVADHTHLQIISADDGTILDTTWGAPMYNPVMVYGLSGSGPAYERGFYITSNVTGSNIISGSSHAGGHGDIAAHDNQRTWLNRGYPGTSSARQALMGIGKLTSSFCNELGPLPFRNYYAQWTHDVPNNPIVDKANLAVSYGSELHKNKRGVIPDPPHFSNNISTGSFGSDLGATYYTMWYHNEFPHAGKIGGKGVLEGNRVGYSVYVGDSTGSHGQYSLSHLDGDTHKGGSVGARIPANAWIGEDIPLSNSVGVGRAEIIAGYTGSTGRTPAATASYYEWAQSIDGPLSGNFPPMPIVHTGPNGDYWHKRRVPHFPNGVSAECPYSIGETAYERYAHDYFGYSSSLHYQLTHSHHPNGAEGLEAGVNGFHAHNTSHAAGTMVNGLEDIYPLGMMGMSGTNDYGYVYENNNHNLGSLAKLSEINRWYTNPVHSAIVRQQDNFARPIMVAGQVTHASQIPDLNAALCSPRTVPSGKFLPRSGVPALTRSLGSLVGFESGAKKLGQLAETKKVKEAVVVMPYVEWEGRRQFVQLNPTMIDRYFGRGDYENTTYWAGVESGLALEGLATSPVSGLQVNLGASVMRQIRLMEDYVIPPHLDFTRAATATPYAMYIFEYEHNFSAQDLSDMWQGLFPDSGKIMRQVTKQVTHKLNIAELLGAAGSDVPSKLKFMVFKVKQRAEINYFAKTANDLDDRRFKFKFNARTMKKTPQYSYNWPYDFFSLVEAAKINMSVTLRNKTLVEDIQLTDLSQTIAMEPVVSAITDSFGTSLRREGMRFGSSLTSVSEASVRASARMASAASRARAASATFGDVAPSSTADATPTFGSAPAPRRY